VNRVQISALGGAGIRLSHAHQRALRISTWAMVLLTRAPARMMGPRAEPISACSPSLSFWSTSIRKCVYPVLCYNQCISFVAIEKYVALFFLQYCWRRRSMCPIVRVLQMAWCVRRDSEPAAAVRRTPVQLSRVDNGHCDGLFRALSSGESFVAGLGTFLHGYRACGRCVGAPKVQGRSYQIADGRLGGSRATRQRFSTGGKLRSPAAGKQHHTLLQVNGNNK
jgi:hypothetical protein